MQPKNETVTDTLDNINRMVEDVPYLKMQMEEEKPEHSRNRIHGTLRQMRRLMVHSRQISKSCWEKTPMVR